MPTHRQLSSHTLLVVGLILVVLLGLFMRLKGVETRIQHDYPQSIRSADANSRVAEAEGYALTRQSYFEPEWFDPTYKDIIAHEPPLSGTLAALLANMSGLEVYDLLYLVAVLSGIGVAVVLGVLIAKELKSAWAGLIAAALLVFPFEQAYHYLILIGMWPHFTTLVFLGFMLLFLVRYANAPSLRAIAGIALSFGFCFYAHAVNAVFGLVFAGLVLLILAIAARPRKERLIHLGILALASFVIILPYFPLLWGNWISSPDRAPFFQPELLGQDVQAAHPVQLGTLLTPILFVLFVIGLVSAFLLLKERKQGMRILAAILLFFLLISMVTNLLGVSNPQFSDKPRYMLYAFLYPLVALGIFTLGIFLERITRLSRHTLLGIALACVVIMQFFAYLSLGAQPISLLNPATYKGYVWIRENIPWQSEMLCFGCVQFEGVHAHRPTYIPQFEVDQSVIPQLVALAQNNDSDGQVKVTAMGHSDRRLHGPIWGLQEYGWRPDANRSACDYDYWIFKEFGQLTPVVGRILEKTIAQNSTPVYADQSFVVVKNAHRGEGCI